MAKTQSRSSSQRRISELEAKVAHLEGARDRITNDYNSKLKKVQEQVNESQARLNLRHNLSVKFAEKKIFGFTVPFRIAKKWMQEAEAYMLAYQQE